MDRVPFVIFLHVFFLCFIDQSYCDRLQQDMAFLTSNGRLSEQLVDKIILQLNRVYPQILTNKEAEKVTEIARLLDMIYPPPRS